MGVRTPSTRAGRRRSETRTFPTMSRSLGVMRDWLVAEGVSIAAIESTSTYWKPPFYCLEEVMDVWLLNAQHMKAVPGRKTDCRSASTLSATRSLNSTLAPAAVRPCRSACHAAKPPPSTSRPWRQSMII